MHLDARLLLGLRDARSFVDPVVVVLAGGRLRLALRDAFLGALVVHRGDEVLVVLRRVFFELGVRLLAVVRGEEEPAIGGTFAGVAEVVVVAGHQNLERDVHLARLVGRNERQRALEVLLVAVDRDVGVRDRHAEARGRDDVLRSSGVVNGDACPPAEFGIWRISSVSNRVRSMRAMRGVLLALMNSQRPSGTPSVCDSSG